MSKNTSANATVPAHGAVAVTPHDSTVIVTTRALYVGVSGNITVRMAGDGNSVLFANVPVGILPVQVDMVKSTGTAASSIVALY